MAVTLLSPVVQVEANERPENTSETMATTSDYQQALEKVVDHMLQQDITSEWQAIGLAKAGVKVPGGYEEEFYKNFESQVASRSGTGRLKITDVERLTMAAVAIGKDPTDVRKFNLLDKIYNSENHNYQNSDTMTYQGNNGLTFALIALDTKNFAVPENARWNRESIIAELIKNQREDGSWSLQIGVPDAKTSYDITAMALIGLAPYKEQAPVKAAIDKAVDFLSEHQGPTGGFNEAFVGGISSEATSQVIIGLTANNLDPQSDHFTKNGINLVDHLLSFQTTDGGFKHTAGESGSNAMATEQALQGLVAYDLYTKGEGRLYDFNEMTPEPQPEIEVAGPSALQDLVNDSLLSVQKKKNGAWSSIFIENTEMKNGYYIVQSGEKGNLTTTIPKGTKKVFLVDNDQPYRYFDVKSVPSSHPFVITFNKEIKNTTTNLNKIYVEDVHGNDVPVSVTANGNEVTVTPQSNYTSGQLYSLFIVEPVSIDDKTLKQATRNLFIIQ